MFKMFDSYKAVSARAVLVAFSIVLPGAVCSAEIIRINVPGAIDTLPVQINDVGQVAGSYFYKINDKTKGRAGFLRELDGTMTTFSVPHGKFPDVVAMNHSGVVVGYYTPRSDIVGGFVFDHGALTTFAFPGSPVTFPSGINAGGTITGNYLDSVHNASHGFLRDVSGSFTQFDVPGIGGGDTTSVGINDAGQVTGYYDEGPGSRLRAFIRNVDGTFVLFDVSNAETVPTAINKSGEVTGYASSLGFIRDVFGNITTFGALPSGATDPRAINAAGEIVGVSWTGKTSFGFKSDISGAIHLFRISRTLWTQCNGINAAGTIVGFFQDTGMHFHGFIANP